jgi:nicotinamidase-related amidase
MAKINYPEGRTAILFVDPYNDFLAEGGKLWTRVALTKAATNLHENLRAVMSMARQVKLPIYIVPHHRYETGDLAGLQHPTPYQLASEQGLIFGKGTWGGEWFPEFAPQPGDIVVKEHWGSSGFANTDLDFLLKQKNITHVILIGLVANTCIEATGRFASELGYHVTLVRDATAAFTDEGMHAAHDLNAPSYAHEILTTNRVVEELAGAPAK